MMNYAKTLLSAVAICGVLFGTAAANAGHHEEGEAKPSIVDIASGNPDFSTLVAALQAGGLVEALSGDGPFTVFAPTNEAFEKLPAGTVETLLKPENKDKLTAILTYHVVSGKVTAADVVKLKEAKTLEGDTVAISASDAGVKIDNATVVATDIEAGNGVIHVIDTVIMPNS
jgi:uncharacterized surface protein with fasciclin (FAS1) repeats